MKYNDSSVKIELTAPLNRFSLIHLIGPTVELGGACSGSISERT